MTLKAAFYDPILTQCPDSMGSLIDYWTSLAGVKSQQCRTPVSASSGLRNKVICQGTLIQEILRH